MRYKDILIQLASMTIPYVYDDTISFLELDRKLYKIVHELIIAMQGLNEDYEQFKTDMTNSFNEFTNTINNNFDEFKSDVNNQISVFEENMTTNFNSFKTEIENDFNTLQGEFNTLHGEFNTLKTYVDNYFANLNLDEEVGEVIQKMYDDGTLSNIINEEVFTELNTKIDNLQEQVGNMELITTITSELSYQGTRNTARYYNSGLRNPSNNELFVVTFPDTDTPYTNVELYYEIYSGGGAGWKITNISGANDIKGQTVLVQARVSDTITFEVISLIPTKDLIQNKIGDLLITNCGSGNINTVGTTYYVYAEAFGTPVDKQLFTIQMPTLPESDYGIKFYNKNQSGSSSYSGWILNGVKTIDVSNGLLLVQASVVEEATTFNVVGILPSKEIIVDKISDLLITDCGTGNINTVGTTYYVYAEAFGTPVDKQLFTIQMPTLPESDNKVRFYNKNQNGSSSYKGWTLNDVVAWEVSNGLLLVQANVVEDVTTFNVIAGKKIDTIMNLADDSISNPVITSEIGEVTNKYLTSIYIGEDQFKLSGFFQIHNSATIGSGNITISPSIIPAPEGSPKTKLFVLKFYQDSANTPLSVTPMYFNWTDGDFILNSGTIAQNATAYYFIVPQIIKFE